MVARPDGPATRVHGSRPGVAEPRVDGPLGQAVGQLAQQPAEPLLPLGRRDRAEREAVDERPVGTRETASAQLRAAVGAPHAHRRAVLGGEVEREVADVRAAPVGQAVPVQVRGVDPGGEHRLDLGPGLALDVDEFGPRHQLGHLVAAEQLAVAQQAGHPVAHRPPAVAHVVAHQGEVHPDRDVGPAAQQGGGLRRIGARRHQARRAHDAGVEAVHDGGVDRGVHAEVVGVHEEGAGHRRDGAAGRRRAQPEIALPVGGPVRDGRAMTTPSIATLLAADPAPATQQLRSLTEATHPRR